MKPVLDSVARPIWRLRRIDTSNVFSANLGYMSNAIIRSATRDDLPDVLGLYRYLHPDDPQPRLIEGRGGSVVGPSWLRAYYCRGGSR